MMEITIKYIDTKSRPTEDPMWALANPTILIKMNKDGVRTGKTFICTDTDESAIKECIPEFLKEFLEVSL